MEDALAMAVGMAFLIVLIYFVTGAVTGVVEDAVDITRSEVGYFNRRAAGVLHVMTSGEEYGEVRKSKVKDCGRKITGFGKKKLALTVQSHCGKTGYNVKFPLKIINTERRRLFREAMVLYAQQ